jgi:predicted nuclease of predicted toxin-antitoxin system
LRLLVDENLAPRLASDLADLFPNSIHVSAIHLGSTPDTAIWEHAKAHGFTFLTKDKDFGSLSLAWGAPPKVILVQTGNCSTDTIERLVRHHAVRLSEFEHDTRRGLLILK